MSKKLQKKAEERLFSRNFTKWGLDMNPVVSITAGAIILLFTGFAFLNLEKANELFNAVNNAIVSDWGWLFILSSNLFIIIAIGLAFSRLGKVVIGGIDAQPEFSNFAWYSMLISAGMGIGLMFYSVGEPLMHISKIEQVPIFRGNPTDVQAMATTFLHWGVHPWGIYALLALALAFFAYNRKLPLSLRSVFYPLLKDKIFGFWGDLIDILAVVACLFGLATSLGLGVQQINSGLNYVFGIPQSTTIQIILIVIITAIATISVVTGLDKGVQFLSKLNMKIAFIFMALIFVLGPTGKIIRLFSTSLGVYMGQFVKSSFYIGDGSFQNGWTVFYLAWWISWSPFVAMFIARISKGRTIREFVLAVLVIPSLLSFMWMSVFGGTALQLNEISGGALGQTVSSNLPVALFEMINLLQSPFLKGAIQTFLSVLGTALVISFFVTSSDSGSLVVDNITSGGKLDSPVPQRIFWACMEGVVAIVLLLIGGKQALKALQTAVVATGLPFTFILIIMSILLLDSVRRVYRKQKYKREYDRFEQMMEEYEYEGEE